METFTKLFSLAACGLGYNPVSTASSSRDICRCLTRPEHMVQFVRDVPGIYPVTKEVSARRTNEYPQRQACTACWRSATMERC
jgi:hypothetical protein